MPLAKQILHIQNSFKNELTNLQSLEHLEDIRKEFLGRKGHIAELMNQLKDLPLEEKKEYGPKLNELKNYCQNAYDLKKKHLTNILLKQSQEKEKYFDVTAYIPNQLHGSLHPLTKIQENIITIFISMGFDIIQGPEVEDERHNFEALNIPKDHPARDMWDTLWLDVPGLLLRTHTSPVQIHHLENKKPPLALAAPGRCFRHEATDASHDFMFNQVEGLLVDKDISLSNLLATCKQFMTAIFEDTSLEIRVRPSYFPFVEPGIEMDLECPFCNHGCSVCKQTEWIEMGGAGLVHPNVLESCGINSKEYSGFAFGFGLTRLAMLKYGIHDIRLLHSNNIEFLKQF